MIAQDYMNEIAPTEFGLSSDRYNFFVNMFETKKQLYDFMEINKGETITEIGAAEGYNLGVIAMLYDSLTIYAQDIDAKTLSKKELHKTIKYYSKKRSTKQTNEFVRVIGTTDSSRLPINTFDKILIINSYHDFDKKDEMLDDISNKLKPNGQLIILDGYSYPADTQTCRDYGIHILTTLPVELKRLEKHGYYVTKMRSPDYNGAHYGNGLFLERNKTKSEAFYKKRNAIEPLVKQSVRYSHKEVAMDPLAMKQLTDSLAPKINEILEVYPEYELWIKDIALRQLRKKEFQFAINVLNANTHLFPSSYQTFYWLGLAYKENKQYDLALKNLKQSLSLNPSNKTCKARIKAVEKLD